MNATAAPRTHKLKTWPEYFTALLTGAKTFEARKDDRGFEVGDRLALLEWMPSGEGYTGRRLDRTITYILRGTAHVSPGFCVLALGPAATDDTPPSGPSLPEPPPVAADSLTGSPAPVESPQRLGALACERRLEAGVKRWIKESDPERRNQLWLKVKRLIDDLRAAKAAAEGAYPPDGAPRSSGDDAP